MLRIGSSSCSTISNRRATRETNSGNQSYILYIVIFHVRGKKERIMHLSLIYSIRISSRVYGYGV